MTTLVLAAADLLAVALLVFPLYFRRHRRRDLVVAFLVVNVGVLAVTLVLAGADAGLGLGLGLFGVLSIIRLRSAEISQREVAYYFAALALGLVAGLGTTIGVPAALGLLALIVGTLWIGDHPRLLRRARQHTVTLDRAISDEAELRRELSDLLGATVDAVDVRRIDLVCDLTVVDVRYHAPSPAAVRGRGGNSGGGRSETRFGGTQSSGQPVPAVARAVVTR